LTAIDASYLELLRSGVQSVAKPAFPREGVGGSKLLPGELGVESFAKSSFLLYLFQIHFIPWYKVEAWSLEPEPECRSPTQGRQRQIQELSHKRHYFRPI
jgi:hypothetical protein